MVKHGTLGLLSRIGATLALVLIPAVASAHVVVTPKQAGIGESVDFSTSVPNEKDQPVIALKLLIPAGLKEVSPNVKPGWTVTVTPADTDGDGVTEIDWTGGSIPVNERDEFVFSAQVPASPTTLQWKAYQTYADGSVVHWDQAPVGDSDDANGAAGPYSQTKIVDDLNVKPAHNYDDLALGLASGALVLSVVAVGLSRRRS